MYIIQAHLLLYTLMPMPKNTDGYACKVCGKTHANRQGRHSHEKRCKGVKSVMKEMERLKTLVNELQANAANSAHPAVNSFGKENMSMLTHEVMRGIIQDGKQLRANLQHIIKTLHFNTAFPQNMNVFLPSMSQGYYLLKNVWNPCSADDLAKRVMFNAADVMLQHRETDNEQEYTMEEQAKFDAFYREFNHDSGVFQSTIRTMIDNFSMVEPRVFGINMKAAFALEIAMVNARNAQEEISSDEDSD